MYIKPLLFSALLFCLAFQTPGQDSIKLKGQEKQWHHLDFTTDSIPGISTNRAYEELLHGRSAEKIVVAILDDGIDISHEDLRGQLWTNNDEIPGNGLDDDENGYIDDIHGWNFLGNPAGENLIFDTYELTRIYKDLRNRFGDADTSLLSEEELKQYQKYLKIEQAYESEKAESQFYYDDIKEFKEEFDQMMKRVEKHAGGEEITVELLDTMKIRRDRKAKKARKTLYRYYSFGFDKEFLVEAMEYLRISLEYHYNPEHDSRAIVGDDPDNMEDRHYGNPQVYVEGQSHGTSVSALVGAIRANGLGIDGIAGNVELMAVRIVPDGDERDKDVANGIYYAVDNGAKILNMSFGKGYSPGEAHVKEAIRYAENKGVLMVSGSGNDGQDNDSIKNFPNKYFPDGTECTSWLSVGATSRNPDSTLVTDFSNYGFRTVDLMAPGEEVFSLAPENGTDLVDGTSFSSPIVAGVAALVWSYFPELTAAELRNILIESASNFGEYEVLLPGSEEEKVLFKELSVTGGIVNAYEAIRLAAEKAVLGSGI